MSDTTRDAIKNKCRETKEYNYKLSSKLKSMFAVKLRNMKTLLVMLATITTLSCFAQKDIPAAVQESFKKNFPGVTVKKWEKEDGNFEANFSNSLGKISGCMPLPVSLILIITNL